MLKKLFTISLLLCSGILAADEFKKDLSDAFDAMRIGNFAEAYCLLKPMAEAGNIEAQYNLGWMYHNGYGLRVNDNLALEWWQSASEHGNTDASFSIAMLYNLGEGQISKNLSKAVDYYLLAAQNKHDEAVIILRSMLTRDDSAIDGRRQELINNYGELFGPVLQVKAKRLNIRRSPSLDGKIVTRLEQGDRVIELHKQGKWSQIGIINSPSEEQTVAWAYNLLLEPYHEPKAVSKAGNEQTMQNGTEKQSSLLQKVPEKITSTESSAKKIGEQNYEPAFDDE